MFVPSLSWQRIGYHRFIRSYRRWCFVAGFTSAETGMPVGVQFNGRHGDDATVLALGKWLHGHVNLTRPSPPGPHPLPSHGAYPPPPKAAKL